MTMKLVDLEDNDINAVLKITDLENMFDIYVDKKLNNIFNLNMSLYVNANKNTLPTFQCNYPMHWTLISYHIYSTTRLAWLLWKINDVSAEDVFKAKQPGDIIYYLPQKQVQTIISNINNFKS